MRTICVIQARMGSTRLPGKVLRDLCGRPLILHVVARAQQIAGVDRVVAAIPRSADNDALAQVLAPHVEVFRWPCLESDVLTRYWLTAQATGAELVVRVTGDCPALDPATSSRVVALGHTHIPARYDYVTCAGWHTRYPDGFDTEAFSWDVLDAAHRAAVLSEREHVTGYIRRTGRCLDVMNDEQPEWEGLKISVDTEEDFARVEAWMVERE